MPITREDYTREQADKANPPPDPDAVVDEIAETLPPPEQAMETVDGED